MKVTSFHRWDVSAKEAILIQKSLVPKVIREKRFRSISKISGVDASYKGGKARAAVVVLSYPDLELCDQSVAELPVSFPYIPGLLSFREGPAVVEAFKKLKTEPDLIIFDGQGIAHPRRLGLASHLGVILGKPSIGCAKSRLIGQAKRRLANVRGSFVSLYDKEDIVGALLRTKPNAQPLCVSIGNMIDPQTSIRVVLSCVRGKERLPETTIEAHCLAGG